MDEDIRGYYDEGQEQDRLRDGGDHLELARTREILRRFLPPPPADVVDVGGGAGVYAAWLARLGYRVHLVDPMPLHVAQAQAAAAAQPDRPFTATLGDARALALPDASADAVLMFGPLYHLTERTDRVQAWREARRVARSNGVVFAAVISRFASLLDGMQAGWLADPAFIPIYTGGLRDGQHRNPTRDPRWFTTAYFHHPDEVAAEAREVGLEPEALLGVEGPGWLLAGGWADPARREGILIAARAVEREPALLGVSAHLLLVARPTGAATPPD
ncbi:MAG TPA: class I SAM-dependent methyltransferase [Thermomicrobiales bacterium]|nr:class I SAM-dependent methyltransferase [Thermomicrobiales bacterium]